MSHLWHVDWRGAWVPSTSLLEVFIRGTVIYLTLFTLLRVLLKRQSGGLGVTDMLVIVLIADAAQNGMSANYQSVPEGIVLVATIVGWATVLDWAAARSPFMERLLRSKPVLIVRDGEPLRGAMRREFVTMDELRIALREEGVHDIRDVQRAYVEPDGIISVTTYDRERHRTVDKKRLAVH